MWDARAEWEPIVASGGAHIEPHDAEPLRVAGGVLSADDALQ